MNGAPWQWREALERLEKRSFEHFDSVRSRINIFEKILRAFLPPPPDDNGQEMEEWVSDIFHFDAFGNEVPKAWTAKTQRKCLISSFQSYTQAENCGPTASMRVWADVRTRLTEVSVTATSKAPICMYPMLTIVATRLARSYTHAEFVRTHLFLPPHWPEGCPGNSSQKWSASNVVWRREAPTAGCQSGQRHGQQTRTPASGWSKSPSEPSTQLWLPLGRKTHHSLGEATTQHNTDTEQHTPTQQRDSGLIPTLDPFHTHTLHPGRLTAP